MNFHFAFVKDILNLGTDNQNRLITFKYFILWLFGALITSFHANPDLILLYK